MKDNNSIPNLLQVLQTTGLEKVEVGCSTSSSLVLLSSTPNYKPSND